MSSCAGIDALVTPYVDGALDPDHRVRVDAHLVECARCRGRIAVERAASRCLDSHRSDLRDERAPTSLLRRCRSTGTRSSLSPSTGPHADSPRPENVDDVDEIPGRTSADFPSAADRPVTALTEGWARRASRLALAALVVLAVGTVGFRATLGGTQAVASELAADHVKCFLMNAVLGTHQSAEEVEASLRSRFEWAADLPERPEMEDLALVGSRPCLYERGMIAHIMYRHRGVPVSIYMLPSEQVAAASRAFGHDAVMWTEAGRTFAVVARAPREQVEQVATFVRASLR
jgi:anti-sigma factor RsiW